MQFRIKLLFPTAGYCELTQDFPLLSNFMNDHEYIFQKDYFWFIFFNQTGGVKYEAGWDSWPDLNHQSELSDIQFYLLAKTRLLLGF